MSAESACAPRPAIWFLAVLLSTLALPARAADPILMFVLGFAKNVIESNMESSASRAAPVAPMAPMVPAVAMKPPASVTNDDLRALVNDSFAYLDRSQRAELITGLEKVLSDPAMATQRDAIVGEFMLVAQQVGFTHRQLDRLSDREKRSLASQFAANYRSLAPDQQQDLLAQLRRRSLPLPSDLNEMMLTALAGAP